MIGERFTFLTVIAKDTTKPRGRGHSGYWVCKCDCGKTVSVRTADLKSGNTKSCGCLRSISAKKTRTTHGQSKTKLYGVWNTMKSRCYNSSVERYNCYGARGIQVCDEWLHDFSAFRDWALSTGYRDGLTIDRIDPNGNYEPTNCRWLTNERQANNRTTNRFLVFNNETHTVSEWSAITGISPMALYHRLNRGWSVEKALTTPQKNKE